MQCVNIEVVILFTYIIHMLLFDDNKIKIVWKPGKI